MTKEQKSKAMRSVSDEINAAKNRMARAADELLEKGLLKDAETLMRMVYRLEEFQNKYNQYR